MPVVASGSHGRLADGMVIAASIRARLLGLRLLDIKADVVVTPSAGDLGQGPALKARRRGARRLPAGTAGPRRQLNGGPVGGSLDEVARALAASESELGAARRRMP